MTDNEVQLMGEVLAQGLILSIMLREPGKDIRPNIAFHIEQGPTEEHLAGFDLDETQLRILVYSFRQTLKSIFKASLTNSH